MAEPAPSTSALLTSEDDSLVEAIVLEDPPVRIVYPYAPGHDMAMASHTAALWPRSPTTAAKTYVVPRRFGISAVLVMMTLMAALFAFLRLLAAPPIVFLFLGVMMLVICLVQMLYGQVPRLASFAAGAVLLPLFVIVLALMYDGRWTFGLLLVAWGSISVGGLGGYFMGTCAAGIFLIIDKIDCYLPGGRNRAASEAPHPLTHETGNG